MSRESMTVWDSRFQAVTDFRIPGTGFQSLSKELGFWILIVSGLLKLYSGLQRAAQDSRFHKQNFPDFGSHRQKFSAFRNPDSLPWGEACLVGA